MDGEHPTGSGTTDALELPSTTSRGPGAPSLHEGDVVLGKYRVVGRLGAGGMAEVYDAVHVQLGSHVALKLPLGRKAGAAIAARLLREAKVGASLDPERVVRVLDVGTLDDGTPAIVLERLDGMSLAEHLDHTSPLPEVDAIRWIRDVCRGLAEAHERGIVHRDIKPSNLFLERRPNHPVRIRILDFGIAQVRAAAEAEAAVGLTDSHAAVGSPPYMSPEQLRDAAKVDARADVWALGVTLFELVTARRPFRGHGAPLVASILSDRAPRMADVVPGVSSSLESIVERCLAKDPAKRPRDAAELGALLDEWLLDARPTGAPRARTVMGALAILGGAAVIAASVWGLSQLSARSSPTSSAPVEAAESAPRTRSQADAPKSGPIPPADGDASARSEPIPPSTSASSHPSGSTPPAVTARPVGRGASSAGASSSAASSLDARPEGPEAPSAVPSAPTPASAKSILEDRVF